MSVHAVPEMNTFARKPITFVSGKGCRLTDDTGKDYLDCLAGIACAGVGHCNPTVAAAVAEQASTLDIVSNHFSNEPAGHLARRLVETAGWGPDTAQSGRVFLANSGAEANECAIKLVRKWAQPGRFKVICADGGFHGRTMLTLAATGQPEKWTGFEPIPSGFEHAPFNDLDAVAEAVDEETAAILVEPIQGEAGVFEADLDFLAGLRELCDIRGLALVFDEIQTGLGRTGAWWAFQSYGVEPDVFTSAKALGNGLPVGACVARRDFSVFEPGDHGTTFGGGPIPAAAALATLEEIAATIDSVPERGDHLRARLADMPHVTAVRGRGLMLAAKLDAPRAAEVDKAALEAGLVINAVRPDALRFLPPLVIGPDEIDEAADKLRTALREVFRD